jgi:hypothetical protein
MCRITTFLNDFRIKRFLFQTVLKQGFRKQGFPNPAGSRRFRKLCFTDFFKTGSGDRSRRNRFVQIRALRADYCTASAVIFA